MATTAPSSSESAKVHEGFGSDVRRNSQIPSLAIPEAVSADMNKAKSADIRHGGPTSVDEDHPTYSPILPSTTSNDAGSPSQRSRRYSTGSRAVPVRSLSAAIADHQTIPIPTKSTLLSPSHEETVQDNISLSSGQAAEKPIREDGDHSIGDANKEGSRTTVDPAPVPREHRAWLRAIPKAILVPSVKIDSHLFEKVKEGGTSLSAFAPPFSQRPVEVNEKGDLVDVDSAINPGVEIAQEPKTLLKPALPINTVTSAIPKSEHTAKRSAWSKGPPASLKALKKVSIANLSASSAGSHLEALPSAYSMFGTESDPATPWDPALRQQQTNIVQASPRSAWNSVPSPETRSGQLGRAWPSLDQAKAPKGGKVPVEGEYSRATSTTDISQVGMEVHPEYAEAIFTLPTPLATPVHPPMMQPYTSTPDDGSYVHDTYTNKPGASESYEVLDVPTVWYPPPMYPWGMPMDPIQPTYLPNEPPVRPQMNAQRRQTVETKPEPARPIHRRGVSSPPESQSHSNNRFSASVGVGGSDRLPIHIPGGLGVMWTPAGWAVQDAAMKLDLRLAEMRWRFPEANAHDVGMDPKKSYYKSECGDA